MSRHRLVSDNSISPFQGGGLGDLLSRGSRRVAQAPRRQPRALLSDPSGVADPAAMSSNTLLNVSKSPSGFPPPNLSLSEASSNIAMKARRALRKRSCLHPENTNPRHRCAISTSCSASGQSRYGVGPKRKRSRRRRRWLAWARSSRVLDGSITPIPCAPGWTGRGSCYTLLAASDRLGGCRSGPRDRSWRGPRTAAQALLGVSFRVQWSASGLDRLIGILDFIARDSPITARQVVDDLLARVDF